MGVVKIISKGDLELISYYKGNVFPEMIQAQRYYRNKNTLITERKKEYYIQRGVTAADPYRANWKLPSNFFKLLTKQKVNYLINKKTTFSQDLEKYLTKFFKNELKKIGEKSSINGYSALQVYINEEGNFAYKIIPSEQIIPIYQDDELVKVIRIYNVIEEGKKKEINEVWDNEKVTIFEQKEGNYTLYDSELNPRPHIIQTRTINNNKIGETYNSWGKPPFCILKNNEYLTSDLDDIKNFIDIYDIILSDFANNIDDFQDIFWILKNYQGQDIDEFFENMKQFKALKVGENGDAKTEQAKIPTEAREKMLSIIEKLIFKFGMGVNPDDIEGNITNVRIKALYSNLDLKVNDFEGEVMDFFLELIYFIQKFNELKGISKEIDTTIEFDRSMMINKAELIDLANKSIGAISEYTRLRNDPRIENVEEEIERMKQEQEPSILPEQV